MKKVVFILFALVLIFCLVSCDLQNERTELTSEEKRVKTLSKNTDMFIWIDEETGVQYIVYCDKSGYSGMGGITPRLNADGTLYITTESEGADDE